MDVLLCAASDGWLRRHGALLAKSAQTGMTVSYEPEEGAQALHAVWRCWTCPDTDVCAGRLQLHQEEQKVIEAKLQARKAELERQVCACSCACAQQVSRSASSPALCRASHHIPSQNPPTPHPSLPVSVSVCVSVFLRLPVSVFLCVCVSA